jgi:hypothetical protein
MVRNADAAQRQASTPPNAVVVAVGLGIFVFIGSPLVRILEHFGVGSPAAHVEFLRGSILDNAINAILGAVVLFGMYRMRRWGVLMYFALLLLTVIRAVSIYGLSAWRGLLLLLIIRCAFGVPSLYYWKKLS